MTVNHNEEQYLDLARHVLEFGDQKGTGPEPELSRSSATRCALTCRKVSRS